MKRAIAVLILATACSKPQARPDSTAADTQAPAGASTAAATADSPPSSTAAIPDNKAAPRPAGSKRPTEPVPIGDVIVGRLDEHGFDPQTFLAITPAGGPQTRVSGTQLGVLGAVKGAELWARGKRETNGFRVDTFEVRRANDQAVADGVVSVAGSTVTVRTSSGTLTYPDAPTALRGAAGARVWITPPVKGQAPSFGIIRNRQ